MYQYSLISGPIENVPVVKAATAYDDPATGITYILIIGQVVYLGTDVDHTLLCPNQLRYNGLVVDDCPKHLAPKRVLQLTPFLALRIVYAYH
jgi:hypothetical protein